MNGKRGFIVQRNTHNKEGLVDSDDKKLTRVDMTETPTKISITIETVGGRPVFRLNKFRSSQLLSKNNLHIYSGEV